jgi:hypothetical protein
MARAWWVPPSSVALLANRCILTTNFLVFGLASTLSTPLSVPDCACETVCRHLLNCRTVRKRLIVEGIRHSAYSLLRQPPAPICLHLHFHTPSLLCSSVFFLLIMSYYTDDAVKAKLSSLNDTHDSVVNVAQWLLFHKFVPPPALCPAHHPPGDTQCGPLSCGCPRSKTHRPSSG